MRKLGPFLGFLILCPLCLAAPDPAAFKAAVELYSQHKPVEAQKAFEALAPTAPDNADIQFYLGRLALQRNDPEPAVGYLEKAVALSPNDSRIHLRLGDAYGISAQKAGFFSQIGWARKCQAEYQKAVELDPRNIEARLSLMEYCRQAPGIVGGGLDKALVQAQEIKKLDYTEGCAALGSIYTADKKYDLASDEYEAALKVKPDDYGALYQTGRLAVLSGARLDRGLAVLQQCLTLTPPDGQPPYAAVHWRMGNILEKKGDKPGARAAYEAALKADPKFPQAIEALKNLN
jgi:tetratricopeptide (TPR) repeat protein